MATSYLTSADLRRIFGNCCQMTIYRYVNDETLNFPQPIKIRGRRYWDSVEIAAFNQRKAGVVLGKRTADAAHAA